MNIYSPQLHQRDSADKAVFGFTTALNKYIGLRVVLDTIIMQTVASKMLTSQARQWRFVHSRHVNHTTRCCPRIALANVLLLLCLFVSVWQSMSAVQLKLFLIITACRHRASVTSSSLNCARAGHACGHRFPPLTLATPFPPRNITNVGC